MIANSTPADEWDNEISLDDIAPLEIPEEYRYVNPQQVQLTVRELWNRFVAGEINIEPDFQRHYVWDPQRASRYIESLILGLPTPPVFLASEQDGTYVVIDGHQRLETVFRFLRPFLDGPSQKQSKEFHRYANIPPLKLDHLEVLPQLNNRDAVALSEDDRRRLWDRFITVILIPRDAHPNMKYVLFARLNQGSMSLNSQEIRNCLYRGPYNTLISKLGTDQSFLKLWNKSAPDKRMRHQELVLRFFALLHRRDRYRPPFRTFLNEEMEEYQNADADTLNKFKREFELGLKWTERIFGNESFRQFRPGSDANPQGRWSPRRYDLVYEVSMVGFALFGSRLEEIWPQLSPSDQQHFRDEIRHILVEVMVQDRWAMTLSQGTTIPAVLNHRFDAWIQGLESAIADPTLSIGRAQYRKAALVQTPSCAMCGHPLGLADDATLTLMSTGGQRLVHHRCKATHLAQLAREVQRPSVLGNQ